MHQEECWHDIHDSVPCAPLDIARPPITEIRHAVWRIMLGSAIAVWQTAPGLAVKTVYCEHSSVPDFVDVRTCFGG